MYMFPFLNPAFKFMKSKYVLVLIKFWDSRPIRVAIYTVFDGKSESEVRKCHIFDPGRKTQEIRISESFFLIFFSFNLIP